MNAKPVVGRNVGRADQEVAGDPPALHAFGAIVAFARCSKTGANVLTRCRAGLVDVADQVDADVAFAAVARVVAPVVDNVVSHVDVLDALFPPAIRGLRLE